MLQPHERVGFGHRQRAQKQAVDGAEQRGVRADPQRKGDDDNGRPALGLEQGADAVAKIFSMATAMDVLEPDLVGARCHRRSCSTDASDYGLRRVKRAA